MAEVAALAGVHGPHQHETTGIDKGPRDAGDRHHAVLQGLAQHLKGVPLELRQLVQKQHAVVCQRDLSRPGPAAPAPGHTRSGHRMVWTAERTAGQHGCPAAQQSGYRVHLAGLQRLLQGHVGQNRGQAFCKHTFAAAWRTDHQNMVGPRRRDLQRALYGLLPHHIGKIQPSRPGDRKIKGRLRRKERVSAEMLCQLGHVLHAVDGQPFHNAGLGCVIRRDIQRRHSGVAGGQRHGQNAGGGPQRAFQAQLSDEAGVPRRMGQLL